jgi:hypothetical protein
VLRQRVQDGVLLRLIGKWLRAGVLEEGQVTYPEAGTPQGGVISPLLSNIFLHTVLDEWFERIVRPRLRGRAMLVRYADDAVLAFACAEDARRVWRVLPQRLARYGLTLHPDKTRLVPFMRPGRGPEQPSTFSFLGFTHYWARSRRGTWVVKRKTACDRFSRAVRAVALWCRRSRHLPLRTQQEALTRKLRGHFAYYGLTGNHQALVRFRYEVVRAWAKWLRRRSWATRLPWDRFNALLTRYPLPRAQVVHSVYRSAATS